MSKLQKLRVAVKLYILGTKMKKIDLTSSDLHQVKLALEKIVSLKDVLEICDCSSIPNSKNEIYQVLKDHPHGGYISLWILGYLAQQKVEWVIELKELYLTYKGFEELPKNLQYLQNIEMIRLEYNPIQKKMEPLLSLPKLKFLAISLEQEEFLPQGLEVDIAYTKMCSVSKKIGPPDATGMDMDPSQPDFLEAKRLWLEGSEESKEKAKELIFPYIRATLIVPNSNLSEEELENYIHDPYSYEDGDIPISEFFLHFEEDESIPMLGFSSVFTLDFKHRAFPYDEEKEEEVEAYWYLMSGLATIVSFEINSYCFGTNSYYDDEDWLYLYNSGWFYFEDTICAGWNNKDLTDKIFDWEKENL